MKLCIGVAGRLVFWLSLWFVHGNGVAQSFQDKEIAEHPTDGGYTSFRDAVNAKDPTAGGMFLGSFRDCT